MDHTDDCLLDIWLISLTCLSVVRILGIRVATNPMVFILHILKLQASAWFILAISTRLRQIAHRLLSLYYRIKMIWSFLKTWFVKCPKTHLGIKHFSLSVKDLLLTNFVVFYEKKALLRGKSFRGRVACKPNWSQGCRNSNKKIYSKNERSFHEVETTQQHVTR